MNKVHYELGAQYQKQDTTCTKFNMNKLKYIQQDTLVRGCNFCYFSCNKICLI